ncbi:hypothetical protein RJ641_000980 [Dillenia turbinata]|uniref:Cupin type-2 domain-containing protein n=1 Tax=Dillenia turbinata TaxID=194707 RepID=A0AAN8ZRY7_9MAGN
MPLHLSSLQLHTLLLSSLSLYLFTTTLANEGFCSAPSFSTDSEPLYYKVTNPTLSPSHLQDLPGYTRSVYKRDHAFITPESHVFSPLPDWINTLGAYLISPAMGSHFVMYLAKMQGNSRSGLPPNDVERCICMSSLSMDGEVSKAISSVVSFSICQRCKDLAATLLFNGSDDTGEVANLKHATCLDLGTCTNLFMHPSICLLASSLDLILAPPLNVVQLEVDSFAYLPPSFEHLIASDAPATLVIFERRYAYLEGYNTKLIVGTTDAQPLLETPGEVFELRKLLPTDLQYDFNIHIMDFQPGEFLNVKEVHYNQHGLLLLEGQGIYRLGDSWYPIQAGDAIWMAPFVPQWYAALGKTRSRYLLYKDVNRNPL